MSHGLLAALIQGRLLILGKSARGASIEATGDPDAIRNIFREKSKSPRVSTLRRLEEVLKFEPDDLISALEAPEMPHPSHSLGHIAPKKRGELPVSGEVAAGIWLEIEHADESKHGPLPLAPDPRYPQDRQFAVLVRGNSINKVAKNGQFLLCLGIDYGRDGLPIVEDGDLAVVERIRPDGLREATVKRLRRGTDGWELHHESTDDRYRGVLRADEGLKQDDEGYEVRVLGKVLWILAAVTPQNTALR